MNLLRVAISRVLGAAITAATIALLVISIQAGVRMSQDLIDTTKELMQASQNSLSSDKPQRFTSDWVERECANPASTSPSCANQDEVLGISTSNP